VHWPPPSNSHAWKGQTIPSPRTLPPWPVVEKNGMIYVWHDREGGAPDWEVPDVPEFGGEAYTPWNHSLLEIKTHPREIVENLVDTAHFLPVHGTDAKTFTNEFRGHIGVQYNEGVAYPLGGGADPYKLTATYYGPAYMVTHMHGVLESILINAHTPIENDLLHLRFAVSLKHDGKRERTAKFAEMYIDNLRRGFLQDVAIWEHKVFRERPLLVPDDGNIGGLRRWYRQFFEPRAEQSTSPRTDQP
jgi:3-ketosteroid 9alpha-monooxygenase subunit A